MSLEEDLMKDIAKGEESLKQSGQGTGQYRQDSTQPVPSGFLPKAMRIKGKIVGEQELQSHKNKINEAVDKLIEVEGIIDPDQKAQMKRQLTDRFNKFSMEMLRKGLDFEYKQKEKIRDAQARFQGSQLLKGIASGVTSTLVGNLDFNKILGKQTDTTSGWGLEEEYHQKFNKDTWRQGGGSSNAI